MNKIKINKTNISEKDLIFRYFPAGHAEVLKCNFESSKEITADDIQIVLWTYPPQSVNSLFRLRDWLVKPLGLQSGNKGSKGYLAKSIRSGEDYRFVSIPDKSENETVLCMNDSHLVMYFSVKIVEPEINQKEVVFTTLVNFHNVLGRLYFFTILPFHYLIVRSMIKQTLMRLK